MPTENLKSGYQRYFIAIIPPSPVFEEAFRFKNYFKENYNSKASLNSPPHITLQVPFEWRENDEKELVNHLNTFSIGKQQFNIELDGFGAFPPWVIFLSVKQSELLNVVQNQLQAFCEDSLGLSKTQSKKQPFHPHLTLAFRDLKKERFVEAWAEFHKKTFSAAFTAEQFTLLKHNGKLWQPLYHFVLNS